MFPKMNKFSHILMFFDIFFVSCMSLHCCSVKAMTWRCCYSRNVWLHWTRLTALRNQCVMVKYKTRTKQKWPLCMLREHFTTLHMQTKTKRANLSSETFNWMHVAQWITAKLRRQEKQKRWSQSAPCIKSVSIALHSANRIFISLSFVALT